MEISGQFYVPITLSPEEEHLDTHRTEWQVQPSVGMN